jgi:cutinase
LKVGISKALGLPGTVALAMMAISTSLSSPVSAQECPDVEVIFARGTHEPPGVGPTGQAFIDALRPQIGDRSLGVYPVNYPATDQWATGVDGVRDASTRILSMANTCPSTDLVLGGYSQGAAVAGFVTSAAVPDGVDPATVPKPLQPEVAEHVAAVVLFGMPNPRAMNFLGEPSVTIGPLYATKTSALCAIEDPVCSDGLNFAMHTPGSYNGDLTARGAAFAASRLNSTDVTPR